MHYDVIMMSKLPHANETEIPEASCRRLSLLVLRGASPPGLKTRTKNTMDMGESSCI